jgi:hypothetical protein
MILRSEVLTMQILSKLNSRHVRSLAGSIFQTSSSRLLASVVSCTKAFKIYVSD